MSGEIHERAAFEVGPLRQVIDLEKFFGIFGNGAVRSGGPAASNPSAEPEESAETRGQSNRSVLRN